MTKYRKATCPDCDMIVCACGTEGGPFGLCEWFALCNRPAVRVVKHPILGLLEVCDRTDGGHPSGLRGKRLR